jgi:uncharacterized membrane protein
MATSESNSLPPRLELFSDAVFAIIITIMVLELRPPTGYEFGDLYYLAPIFLSYILSFVYLIIYWNNHHHLLRVMDRPTGAIMWSNAHLLFWLSLVPFTTAWLGESHGASAPAILYGIVLLGAACAYFILQKNIIRRCSPDSALAIAIGKDIKGIISIALYALAVVLAFFIPLVSYILFGAVAIMWMVPDKRTEKAIQG